MWFIILRHPEVKKKVNHKCVAYPTELELKILYLLIELRFLSLIIQLTQIKNIETKVFI